MQARRLREQSRKRLYVTEGGPHEERTETVKWKKPPVTSFRKVRREQEPSRAHWLQHSACREMPPNHTADVQDVEKGKALQAFREREKKTQTWGKQRVRKQDSFRCPTARDRKLEDTRREKLPSPRHTVLSQATDLTGPWKETLCLERLRGCPFSKQGHKPRNGGLDSRTRACIPGVGES